MKNLHAHCCSGVSDGGLVKHHPIYLLHGWSQLCSVHSNVRFLLEFISKMLQPEF